jgi:Domain of unknown function (DUF4349)
MDSPRDGFDLTAELRALRPEPQQEFAAGLDTRVAAGFARVPRSDRFLLSAFAARFRGLPARRWAAAAGGLALIGIATATVVIDSSEPSRESVALDSHHSPIERAAQGSKAPTQPAEVSAALGELGAANAGRSSSGGLLSFSGAPPTRHATPMGEAAIAGVAGHAGHRDIERSAEIGLLADPSDVDEDSARVFGAVHDADGIVLRSTTTTGRRAGAHFELLIPSPKLGDALAAFSAIDQVRTRHEATADITAPTVAAGERLRDSRAKIDGLLSRLAAAQTESEATAIEVELRAERRREAVLRSHVAQLQRRTDYTRVDLRIETGASSSGGGGWGLGDAFHDSGHILGIAAGVILVGLAVLFPLALLCLLSLLAFLAWRRGQRKRALRAA